MRLLLHEGDVEGGVEGGGVEVDGGGGVVGVVVVVVGGVVVGSRRGVGTGGGAPRLSDRSAAWFFPLFRFNTQTPQPRIRVVFKEVLGRLGPKSARFRSPTSLG